MILMRGFRVTRIFFLAAQVVCIALCMLYWASFPLINRPKTRKNEKQKSCPKLPFNSAFPKFTNEVTILCHQNFWGFGREFAQLFNVLIDPAQSNGNSGGEKMAEVLGQDEKLEYLTIKHGYFGLHCEHDFWYNFNPNGYLSSWMTALEFIRPTDQQNGEHNVTEFLSPTLAVKRIEYANLYQQVTDFFNAFLVCRILDLDPRTVDVLLIDAHPRGKLDNIWEELFAHVTRAGSLKNKVLYKHLIWSLPGYQCPLHDLSNKEIPQLDEFSDYVLNTYGILQRKSLSCENLTVLLVLRKDYVAHPRNPTGIVKRKIRNEKEVIKAIQDAILVTPNVEGKVIPVQFDNFTFSEQVRLASSSDVMIGMHGAGLSHTLFLPKHGSLIEIFPSHMSKLSHFEGFTRFRSLRYLPFQLHSVESKNGYNEIPSGELQSYVKKSLSHLCPLIDEAS